MANLLSVIDAATADLNDERERQKYPRVAFVSAQKDARGLRAALLANEVPGGGGGYMNESARLREATGKVRLALEAVLDNPPTVERDEWVVKALASARQSIALAREIAAKASA